MSIHRLPVQRNSKKPGCDGKARTQEAAKWNSGRMYAICFDLDTAAAKRCHPTHSETAAYKLIETVFESRGFSRQQGSVYFGTRDTTPVDCVLVVQELVKRHPWVRFAIRDIRMLRVEETNDLSAAIGLQGDLPLGNQADG